MSDGGAFLAILLALSIVFVLGVKAGAGCGHDVGVVKGQCRELCKPEKFIEPVNGDAERLCTTKRARRKP